MKTPKKKQKQTENNQTKIIKECIRINIMKNKEN